jgi:hypothetical protein
MRREEVPWKPAPTAKLEKTAYDSREKPEHAAATRQRVSRETHARVSTRNQRDQ